MRWILCLIVVISGCGQSAQDKIAITELTDEVRELSEYAAEQRELADKLRTQAQEFDPDTYAESLGGLVADSSQLSPDDIEEAKQQHREYWEGLADEHTQKAETTDREINRKQELLNSIQ